MAINLVTFAAQTVTPQDDALIYESALLGSGMIYGGAVTIKSANVLHVAAGHGALCGRKFTIEETDVAVSLTASGSLNGRLYIHMDLSDTDEPISLLVETAENLTPVVQDDNVNIINGVYEINLATFTVDTSSLDNLVDVTPVLSSVNSALTNKQNATDNNLATTDKTVVGAINEVNTGLSGKASTTDVNNKHKVSTFEVTTSSWTQDTTSQSGTTLQKKAISLNHCYVDSPSVDIGAASGSVLPTTAQQTAYDLLQYVTIDGTTLYLYASDVPTDAFYISVEGVD